MKIRIILSVFVILTGCKGKQPETWFTPEKATAYFGKIEAACNSDNGKLWGQNLYGPLMFVDRTTRKIVANQPDSQGLLKEKDRIYTGSFPREWIVYNSSVNFGKTLFALSPLPAEEDETRIIRSGIHSLFHRFQASIGYRSSGYNTRNMDEKNARIWIKLEWKALQKAIMSEGAEKEVLIRDALIFKGANREVYRNFATDETRFENYEGLATFTYLLLTSKSSEDYLTKLFESLDRIYSMQSYARSYGSIHGALYATLLYQKGFDFTGIRSEDLDLGEKVKEIYNIQLPSVCRDVAGSLALNYDIETIRTEEATREAKIRESINRQMSTFTEKPVVFLELESPYFDFEPEDVHSMDTLGTIYTRMRVSDNWGKLSVDKGGCLVSNNLKYLRITAKGFKADRNRFEGEGWIILLNDDWEIIPLGQNYFIRRLIP